MSPDTTLTFQLPAGWTLRKVAGALAREWLTPFRAEPAARGARWVLQSILEDPDNGKTPLWEAGISTRDYEERLNRTDLAWCVRASARRGKGSVLVRLTMNEDQPQTFQVVTYPGAVPEALFDPEKVAAFLQEQGTDGAEGLLAAVLVSKGFRLITG